MGKVKYPNPSFFRAKTNMDWRGAQGSAAPRREAPGQALPLRRHGHGAPGMARREGHRCGLRRVAEDVGHAAGHLLQGPGAGAERHLLVPLDDLLYVLRGLHGQEHHGPAGHGSEDEPSDDLRYLPLRGGELGVPGQVRQEERQQRRTEQEGGPLRRDDHGPDHGRLPRPAGHPLSADAGVPGVRDRSAHLRSLYRRGRVLRSAG